MRRPARLVSMAELAAIFGYENLKPKPGAKESLATVRVRRQMLKLHASRPGKWLTKIEVVEHGMTRSRWRVNLSLLRHDHPELFEVADPADIEGKVEDLAERVRHLEQRSRALGAGMRQVNAQIQALVAAMAQTRAK